MLDQFENELYSLYRKYPQIDKNLINDLLEDSCYKLMSLRGDFEIEVFTPFERNWCKRCAIELIEKGSIPSNVSSYSENGYSVTYFTDDISMALRNEILPQLKVVK